MDAYSPKSSPYIQLIHKTRSFKLSTDGVNNLYFTDCWNSQTLESFSTKFDRTVWSALRCNQWTCKPCSRRKISALARRVNTAKPNRLLTLTIDPSKWDEPQDSFNGTRRKVPELFRSLRNRYGNVEYLRVTELTAKGWPHYHCLVRSPYIPHAVVKGLWEQLTGATIVDLRQVKNKFQCYIYLVKYLSKMHNLGWTNRHVSNSKAFFPAEPDQPKNPYGLQDRTVIEARPGKYLTAAFRGATLIELAHGLYAIKRDDEEVPDE